MVTVPAATPFTIPVDAPTVAIVLLLLLQVPPLTVEVSVAGVPVHTLDGPLMVPAVAPALTVTVVVATAVPQLLVTL